MSQKEIMVSVYCLAYNHEKYIKKTLEGFVMQKTKFQYEVFVHDDASTDNTASIIREYAEKYPQIIKPIFQRENQYSKNIEIVSTYIFPRMSGKYIAACEGDDFWCDSNKLQIQFDEMEKNPFSQICVHKTKIISEEGIELNEFYPQSDIESGNYYARDFMNLICTDFFQLSSYFWRRDCFREYIANQPEFAKVADVGDIPLILYLTAHSKKIYYFDKVMSCYRKNSISSWNRRLIGDREKIQSHCDKMVLMIGLFDEYTCHEFKDSCNCFKHKEVFDALVKEREIKKILKNNIYRKMFKEYSVKTRLSLILKSLIKR